MVAMAVEANGDGAPQRGAVRMPSMPSPSQRPGPEARPWAEGVAKGLAATSTALAKGAAAAWIAFATSASASHKFRDERDHQPV